MAGETTKTEAICLRISPWSTTSHIVTWLTPSGVVSTAVKGAVRPKSAFLGQYDLNYTCEIVYYLRAHGDLHALRECTPLELREGLRNDYRSLVMAEHFRSVAGELAPSGPDAAEWAELLAGGLDRLAEGRGGLLAEMLRFETAALRLAGLSPEIEALDGAFSLRGERKMPIPRAVAECIRNPEAEKNREILLDAARAIGVFYTFHLESAPETRRAALNMAANKEEGKIDG